MPHRLLAVLSTIALVISLGAPACARGRTLRGRVVDEVCYLQDPKANSGDNHPGMASDCATTCAQKGSQVALVTDDGTLYELTGGLAANNNAKLIAHIAHTVEIRGDVTKQDGQLMLVADDLKRLDR